jgi:hypothetical protein
MTTATTTPAATAGTGRILTFPVHVAMTTTTARALGATAIHPAFLLRPVLLAA